MPHLGCSPFAAPALSILPGMANSVASRLAGAGLGAAAGGLITRNPFGALVGAGLGSIIGAPLGFGGALGGAGQGSWNPNARPGLINNTSSAAERNHAAQNDAILNDPNLSVEDAVMLMMMNIMNKMDDDIKKQAQKVNKMSQQQNASLSGQGGQAGGASRGGKSGGGKGGSLLGKAGAAAGTALGGPVGGKIGGKAGNAIGGAIGGQGANGAQNGNKAESSVDVETKKMERMMTKRKQMFQMLSEIMNAYKETAKNTIQSINR